MLITRRAEFSASHVCGLPSLTAEQNRELYGAAANKNGHGHNYVLEVTLEGDPDPVTGMIFDLKTLKEVIQKNVV
jgi:6-pyruvoyltetrahydropterin/6-carboxytetrahydropterin synthase